MTTMVKKICFNCGSFSDTSYPLCSKCYPLWIQKDRSCNICGIETSKFVKICPACREEEFSFETNYSFFSYSGLAKEVLTQFKFKKDQSFAIYYAELIEQYIKKYFDDDYILSPVPTSILKRKLKNGYQLDSIIRELKRRDINIAYLLKKRYSKTQKKLGKAERKINLSGSFFDTKKSHLKRNIILLDDVFTTGATINECSLILKEKSKVIHSLTLYRD